MYADLVGQVTLKGLLFALLDSLQFTILKCLDAGFALCCKKERTVLLVLLYVVYYAQRKIFPTIKIF